MRRATLLCMIAGAATFIIGTSGPAVAGGGGCHTGATQGDATWKTQATVRIIDACFTASILKVDPETPVTFVSMDAGLTHNVGGNEWGQFDDMHEGDAFTATFYEEGVYPFACSYHPGMTGAIVVGDGVGPGNGQAVGVTPLDRKTTAGTAPTATAPAASSASPLPWIAAGLGGLVIGAALTVGVGRRGRTAPAA